MASTDHEVRAVTQIPTRLLNKPAELDRERESLGVDRLKPDRTFLLFRKTEKARFRGKIQGTGTFPFAQVSRAAAMLDEELETWRNRPIGQIEYLVLDARYKKVRVDGSVRDCAVLIAVGILPDGHRTVLGVSVSLSEAEVHWREFLQSLGARGMRGVRYIVSDDHSGLKAARQAVLPSAPWQRCQFHLAQNAMHYVPNISMRAKVTQDIRDIFDAKDQQDATAELKRFVERYAETTPKLATWAEHNIPEGLTVIQLPLKHRKRMRTTNMLERQSKEIKRRTRVATLFPNEQSVLRLITAVLVELSDEWETGPRYLTIDSTD